jgi:hypothetical protein
MIATVAGEISPLRYLIAQLPGPVTFDPSLIALVRGNIPLSSITVALVTYLVPPITRPVSPLAGKVPLFRGKVPLVGSKVPLIRGDLPRPADSMLLPVPLFPLAACWSAVRDRPITLHTRQGTLVRDRELTRHTTGVPPTVLNTHNRTVPGSLDTPPRQTKATLIRPRSTEA